MVEGPEHVKHVYEQAEIYFKTKFILILTRAGRNTIVVLACVAGTGASRNCSIVRRRTSEASTRRGLTSRTGLQTGWKGH